MKVWITKYALTDGIFEADVEPYVEPYGNNISYVLWDNGIRCIKLYCDEFYLSKKIAIKKAKEMCRKEIESLKKMIEKLENEV